MVRIWSITDVWVMQATMHIAPWQDGHACADGEYNSQPVDFPMVKRPVSSGILKRVYRQISQSVCPWNVKFSQMLADDSPFGAREFTAGKDSLTLARDMLALDQEQFSAAFRKSPMKRAKLARLRRNSAVALENASWGQSP